MSLPQSLLDAVESHSCFTGCYTSDLRGSFCDDPSRPARPMVGVHCSDCLTWHVGAFTHLLPPSASTPDKLARALSDHMQQHRGFSWSVSGYHLASGGFWVAAAGLGPGVFIVSPDRGAGHGREADAVDALIKAFHNGLAPGSTPSMLDPKQYATQMVYLKYSPGSPATPDKASLLRSPQCSTRPATGHHAAVIIEHLPSLAASAPAGAPPSPSVRPPPSPSPRPSPRPSIAPPLAAQKPDASRDAAPRELSIGQRCPKCGHEVKVRHLLHSAFVGCMC
ncbi:MAG: hypothetical protein AAGF11_32555 [Myxococcota bacterium]